MQFRQGIKKLNVVFEPESSVEYVIQVRRSSKRRTIELRITAQSEIRVLCPAAISDEAILDFVRSKSNWIQSKLTLNAKRNSIPIPRYEHNSIWRYRGIELPLNLEKGDGEVALEPSRLVVRANEFDQPTIEAVLQRWFLNEATTYLTQRTAYFAEALLLNPTRVQLKTYRSMWGRCNSRGEIAYDWRVIQAPDSVIDYLVIHELSHLRHFNHSRDFWSLVASQAPNYRESKQWLRDHASVIKSVFLG